MLRATYFIWGRGGWHFQQIWDHQTHKMQQNEFGFHILEIMQRKAWIWHPINPCSRQSLKMKNANGLGSTCNIVQSADYENNRTLNSITSHKERKCCLYSNMMCYFWLEKGSNNLKFSSTPLFMSSNRVKDTCHQINKAPLTIIFEVHWSNDSLKNNILNNMFVNY